MSIKETIEKNILVYSISVVIVTVGITFKVLQFFHNENLKNIEHIYQTKLDECNNTISSINRGLGNDAQRYFNVKKVFVKSTDKLGDASKLKFYNSDEFYALSDSSYWKHSSGYSYTDGEEYSKLDKINRDKIIAVLKKHHNIVHFWFGGKNYKIEKSSIYDSLGSQRATTSIAFEKINVDSLAIQNAETQEAGHIEEFKIWYKKEGLVNTLLSFIVQQRAYSYYYKETSFDIQDMQIQDDFIYLRAISTIKNSIIDDKKLENFYIKSESIGLLKNGNVYLITIVEPVTDILSSDPEITKWLNSLKIITN